jgi:hypothetical protein
MNDKTELIIDKAEAALANKGVRLISGPHEWPFEEGEDPLVFVWEGMANKRRATCVIQRQPEDLSDDAIDAKVNEIITHVERVIRAGGEKEAEE